MSISSALFNPISRQVNSPTISVTCLHFLLKSVGYCKVANTYIPAVGICDNGQEEISMNYLIFPKHNLLRVFVEP
jgi:hypothetical protein